MQRELLLQICAVVVVLLLLENEKKAHNRPKLFAKSLVPRSLSPWSRMFVCGGDRDFVHVMGLDRKAFHTLLVPFTDLYNNYNVLLVSDHLGCRWANLLFQRQLPWLLA